MLTRFFCLGWIFCLLSACPERIRPLEEGEINTDFSFLKSPVEKVAAIFIHDRNSALFVVVQEMINNLPDEWIIQIFHLKTNESFIRESPLKNDIEKGKIVLSKINRDSFSLGDYNTAFLTPNFFKKMLANTVLVFEVDSALCPRAKEAYALDAFIHYDYVGAPWESDSFGRCYIYEDPSKPGEKFVDFGVNLRELLKVYGYVNIREFPAGPGNSGLALRNRDNTIAMLDKYRPVSTLFFQHANDLFYACVGADPTSHFLVPPSELASQFSVETIFYNNPLGFHKPWNYSWWHKPEQLNSFLRNCPTARIVAQANNHP